MLSKKEAEERAEHWKMVLISIQVLVGFLMILLLLIRYTNYVYSHMWINHEYRHGGAAWKRTGA